MKIPNFGLALVKFCLALSISAYTRKYNEVDEILFESFHAQIYQPFFYVAKHQGDLWIVIRGSDEKCDFDSIGSISPVRTKYGVMTEVFSRAAEYVYFETLNTVKNFDGRIFITGHSLGAGTSAALLSIYKTEFPNKEFYAIPIAPPPVMDDDTSEKYKDYIASIVNSIDLIPSFSPKTVALTIEKSIPGFEYLSKSVSLDCMYSIFQNYNVTGVPSGQDVLDTFVNSIPIFVDYAIEYKLEKSYEINYPPGTVYHIGEHHKNLDECVVDPKLLYTSFNTDPYSFAAHPPLSHEDSLQLIDE